MTKDEFNKLFQYMQKEFAKVNERLDDTSTTMQVDKLINTVDGLAGFVRDYQ